jgi:hypothetical protein
MIDTIRRLTDPGLDSEFIYSALERADFVLEDAMEAVQAYKLRQDQKLSAKLEEARQPCQMVVTPEVVDDFTFAVPINHNKNITYRPINYPLYVNKYSRAQH